MKKNNMLQGQQVEVIMLCVNIEECQATLSLRCIFNDDMVNMVFKNVTNLKVQDFSVPFQICGFEILDNKNRGWENNQRYTFHDYENEVISFICEDYEIS